MELNQLQTQITEELKKNLSKEVYSDLIDCIENTPLVSRMISTSRGYAKDRPRDKFNKIVVDVVNPHILEDMDYFRPAMLFFEKNEIYTNLTPNAHPLSEYAKFWAEEARRCREGLVRESDGEWITGLNYFYWNYSPILKLEERSDGRRVRIHSFASIWDGDYLLFHYIDQARVAQKHCNVLKSRGKGFSFKGSSILNKFFIHGDRQDPVKSQKNQIVFAIANEREYLIKDGVLNKFLDSLKWTTKHTPWPRNLLKESMNEMHWKLGYINSETNKEEGVLNEVIGVSLKNDPDKARGKRGPFLIWEEMGKFPDLLKAWSVARPSVESGNLAFGTMFAFGTGGTDSADFRAAEEMFYNPGGYNVLGIENVFDKNIALGNTSAFFFPEYLNREECYDKNGNSDIIKALIEIFQQRAIVRYGTTDPSALTQEKAERPIYPQEAILRKEGNLFPVAELKDYIAEIMPTLQNFVAPHYVGRVNISQNGSTSFAFDPSVVVIRDFPLKDNLNKAGAVEIFQPPVKLFDGTVPRLRYIMGVDPVDDDYSQTTSLVSAFVFDRLLDKIVAEYTGRPRTAIEAYDIIYRLARHYNALINYENDKKGLFGHFVNLGATYMLCDTPSILRDMEVVKETRSYGNKAHPYSQKVYTPDGIKLWGKIKIGDKLFNTYGGTTKVIDIPYDSISTIYEIELKDGRLVYGSDNHLWNVVDWNDKKEILSTKDIEKYYYRNKGKYKEYKYYIEKNDGVEYKTIATPIDSYLLGLLLGDGCFPQSTTNNAYFTSSILDMNEYKKYIKYEYVTLDNRHHRIRIPQIGNILKTLNLKDKKSSTKFIPDIYKYNSKEIRFEILRGLLDTDGTVGYGGNAEYVTTSSQLSLDVVEITRSLGINCNLNIIQNKFGPVYKVRFYTDKFIFKLERKLSKQRLTKTRSYKTAIVNIKKIGEECSKCVTVDSVDNSYLIGDYVSTHNSKGTPSGTQVNALGRRLQADWLISKAIGSGTQMINDAGELVETDPVMNLHRLRSIGYIKELISWNPDGNFDRISAMGMCMILRQEYMKFDVKNITQQKKTVLNDKFFERYAIKNSYNKQY